MTTFRINVKGNQVAAYLNGVPKAVERAAYRAINQMSPYIRKESIDGIIGYRRLSRREVGKGIIFAKRARVGSLSAVWRAVGVPLDLKDFVVAPKGYVMPRGGSLRASASDPARIRVNRAHRYPSPPIVVEVTKGHRTTLVNSFIGPNGHVYRRVGASRLKIKKRMVPSIPATFIKQNIQASLVRTTNQRLPRMVSSEMVREVRRIETGKLPPLR